MAFWLGCLDVVSDVLYRELIIETYHMGLDGFQLVLYRDDVNGCMGMVWSVTFSIECGSTM